MTTIVVPSPCSSRSSSKREAPVAESAALGDRPAPVRQAVGDVVEHAEAVEQEELLEDEAEAARPQPGQLRIGHDRGVLTGDPDHAAARSFQGSHHMQKRALARPGRSDDGDQRVASCASSTHRCEPRNELPSVALIGSWAGSV
jgi:hypothetical protein